MKAWIAARTVKEWLALIALLASIGGAAVLTLNFGGNRRLAPSREYLP
jgi:hypothetical protein